MRYKSSVPPAWNASGIPWGLLIYLPVVGTPFERIEMDLVSPLEKSAARFQHILVILDNTTWYPEAIPLCSTKATALAPELMKVFIQMIIPQEIITDQGTNFMYQFMRELYSLGKIKSLRAQPPI